MPGIQAPCNRGQRLIVVHAGSRSGFVNGAQLIYKASSCTGDYHREMNGQNFKKVARGDAFSESTKSMRNRGG